MSRHKQHLDAEAAQTAEKLERLRQAQEDLERKKRELEDARRKQLDFIKGKQELVEHLSQSLASLERNELRATQMVEVFQNTRRTFRAMMEEISGIDEAAWNDETVRDEISVALGRINDARMDYNKAMARIDALTSANQPQGEGHAPIIFEEPSASREPEHGFRHWMMIGVAVSLPLALLLATLFVIGVMVWRSGALYR
jgi:uncharacterized membrane protein YccC